MKYILTTTILCLSLCVMASSSEHRLIRKDRIWVCQSYAYGRNIVKYMKFIDEKSFDEIEYSRVATVKRVTWDMGKEDSPIVENDILETEAWMREENGIVYMRLDGLIPFDDYQQNTYDQEYILYNFNAEVDESFIGMSHYRAFDNNVFNFFIGENTIIEKGTDIVGDNEVASWKIQFKLSDDTLYDDTHAHIIIDGVGIVDSYGCLYYAETFMHTSGFNNYNAFRYYMDTDGNVLYPSGETDITPGGGVSGVSTLADEIDKIDISGQRMKHSGNGSFYDMMGRRIREPEAGQLYIQDGKKHIGR